MNQARSPTASSEVKTSSFRNVLSAELKDVLPNLGLPADEIDDDTALGLTFHALDHPTTEDLAALCLSGGGIRSASFGLGVLQGLACFGLLGQFHYLSTVSGGGYIGSWLSAWRSIEDDSTVIGALKAAGREPPQIKAIRADSNYITPTLGLLSADTWTVVAIYVRNLLLNWALFLPFFTGCLLFPHWYQSALIWARHDGTLHSKPWLISGCVLLTIALSCAVCGRFRRQGEWLSRARFLSLVLAPIVLSAVCFTVAAALAGIHRGVATPPVSVPALLDGMGIGALIYVLAWLFGRVAARRWDRKVLVPDLVCWILSGAVVGVLISLGLQLVEGHTHNARLTAVLGLSGVVLAYLAGDIVYVGASSLSRRGDMDREWLARASGWLAAVAVSWGLVSALSLYGPGLLLGAWEGLTHGAWGAIAGLGVGGVSGILTLFLGPSTLTAATKGREAVERVPLMRIASIAAFVFAVILVALLSLLGHQLLCKLQVDHAYVAVWADLPVMAALIGGSFLISLFVNVNRFSLHAMYRNRLVRAFLGSARGPARQPDPFTGFDPNDNPNLSAVVPASGTNRLFHVINTTLNVVSTSDAAWQERKAESFAMTRQYCGNSYVGYQPTNRYGGRRGGISLGTAMAISGAAVSPNQGYNSSPLVGFLLMLFNVRLGWWLGNPRRKYFGREAPVWSITPALKELAGATTDQGRWIYLSDGGHFDNLGLYEMVRRRCRFIVVVDAGCDPDCKLEDLGNAARKIYLDFGVSIDFGEIAIQARQNPPVSPGGARFATATITYPGSTRTGWLLYIKPTYYCTTEGMDIRGYASDHPTFPHESTTDQWFSESQLEAYRALAAHIIEHICSGQSIPPGQTPVPATPRGPVVAPGQTPAPVTLQSFRSAAEAILAKS